MCATCEVRMVPLTGKRCEHEAPDVAHSDLHVGLHALRQLLKGWQLLPILLHAGRCAGQRPIHGLQPGKTIL